MMSRRIGKIIVDRADLESGSLQEVFHVMNLIQFDVTLIAYANKYEIFGTSDIFPILEECLIAPEFTLKVTKISGKVVKVEINEQ